MAEAKNSKRSQTTIKPSPRDPSEPEAIVGVGASAGGLEAIEDFFKAMPNESGMAFVVIQHLSPDHKSLMVELLSRKTEIPVMRAEDGVKVAANHIYLIPPKKNLTLFHGKLLLEDQEPREGINLPVDIFLRSLAEDQGERAVAVVLSGTGSDGTRGVRAIKEWGGLVMVQDEESAKFDGMPRAAASTGVADFILPPYEMPAQLTAWLHHPYATRQQTRDALADETGVTRLFSLLRAKTKVDFTYYKPSTIMRRIERRIAVTQVEDLDEYVGYVEQNTAEIAALYRELLIGVTSFFRDPVIMEVLQDRVLPELIERSAGREIRFWVAGCSTGEEAYTMAILTREVMLKLGAVRDVKIFATDIDRDAIQKAGAGTYPASIAADLNPGLLAKYFQCHGDTYQVARNLREMVIFAQHNLVRDPPFTRIDMVSCRNLLIYLQSNLQQHALNMFRFSLNPGGFLLLGHSETVGEMEDQFKPIDRKARIYTSRGKPEESRSGKITISDDNAPTPPPPGGFTGTLRAGSREHERLLLRLVEALSTSYVPLAVVVNENLEILHSVGNASGIFTLPSGRAVFDISKMVDKELAVPLATGIQKVFRTGEELLYSNVRLHGQDTDRNLRLRIKLMPGRRSDERLAVVFFEQMESVESQPGADAVEYDLDEETRQRLQDLEQDLQFTRESLQATIEELETSNEELQATNEELLASNEELQSTNEELQSTNEELYTVNAEYQNKIIELTETQNDVDNLLTSSRMGTVILDEDLCIRRFSPQATSVFNLVESDVGRPLKHLSHKLIKFDPVATAEEVARNGHVYEQDIKAENDHWYLVRVIPYQVSLESFSGIIITVIDITPLHDTRERLVTARQSEAGIVRHMPSGLFVYDVTSDGDLVLSSLNPAAVRITGLQPESAIGKRFSELWPDTAGDQLKHIFLKAFETNETLREEEFAYDGRNAKGIYNLSAFRLPGNRLAVSFEDISQHKLTQGELHASEEQYRCLYRLLADAEKTARMGSWTWDVKSDAVTWSENLFRIFGRKPEDGAPSFAEHDALYTEESMQRLRQAVTKTLETGEGYEIELDALRCDGGTVPCIARGEAEQDEAGEVKRLYGSLQEK